MIAFPRTLYSTKSEFSGEIAVIQKGRERQLLVDGYVQSVAWGCPGVKKRVWGAIAEEAVQLLESTKKSARNLKTKPAVPKILILGLGAGTEIHLLSHQYPNAQFIAIEVDPIIISIAKKYFDIDKIPNLKIINKDAFAYLKKSRFSTVFDLIICDIYAGGHYPPEAESDWFLRKLSTASKSMIFNRIFESVQSPDAKEYLQRLRYYFKTAHAVPVHHKALNILFICTSTQPI